NITGSSTVELGAPTPTAAMPPASTTKADAAQAAAFMLSSNSAEYLPGGGVAIGTDDPHEPPLSWTQDSATARNGAFHSSLAVGSYGPGAIDAYMDEDDPAAAGAENNDVGHRRYILYSRIQEMATGDVTSTSSPFAFSSNALYVSGNLLSSPTPQFIAWPNPGYFPAPLLPTRWSLSYPNADFSNATVTINHSSGSIGTTIVSTTASYGDATIAWKLNTPAPSTETADQSYTVTISNIIINGVTQSHTYTTTIINPERLLESSELSGSIAPPDSGADYFFQSVQHAESYQYKISSLSPATWIEGAENATYITNNTTLADSTLRSTNSFHAGSRSLRMAFSANTETMSSVDLVRSFIPNASSQVQFHAQRGVMLGTTTWAIQIRNGNGQWEDLKTLTNSSGTTNYPIDSAFVQYNINIPVGYHGSSSSLRLVYRKDAAITSFEVAQHSLVGVFTDEITLVNCDSLDELNSYTYDAASISKVSFNSTTAGESLVIGKKYLLSFSVTVGCKDFGFGEALEVIPVSAASLSPYELWFRSYYAIIGDFEDDYDGDGMGNGLERIFGLDPMNSADATSALTPELVAGNLQLSHAIISGASVKAEYSETLEAGSWEEATVTIVGGIATATVPADVTACFIRWKVENP
ncbi:MAG: hypothetical protein KJO79_03000, partial [Verrucomicrobiae bacterium]|nr:hypothetical protein [Verrucomicrobiae bacterium]NNJ86123.1 hypothetical protein [Akkermansiaceae bacterium]